LPREVTLRTGIPISSDAVVSWEDCSCKACPTDVAGVNVLVQVNVRRLIMNDGGCGCCCDGDWDDINVVVVPGGVGDADAPPPLAVVLVGVKVFRSMAVPSSVRGSMAGGALLLSSCYVRFSNDERSSLRSMRAKHQAGTRGSIECGCWLASDCSRKK